MIFLYSQWTKLPIGTRTMIAAALGIERKRPTHVIDNRVSDDGYLADDIEARLTVESLQAYLKTDEADHLTLFNMLVDSFEPEPVVVQDILKTEPMPTPEEVKKAVETLSKMSPDTKEDITGTKENKDAKGTKK